MGTSSTSTAKRYCLFPCPKPPLHLRLVTCQCPLLYSSSSYYYYSYYFYHHNYHHHVYFYAFCYYHTAATTTTLLLLLLLLLLPLPPPPADARSYGERGGEDAARQGQRDAHDEEE